MSLATTRPDILARFWSKVNKTETCWLWVASRNDGYGQFWAGGTMHAAHRMAFEIAGREIPRGLQLDHLCRVRHCVNPGHLEIVSSAENTKRSAIAPATINAAKTHCPKSHPYAGGNLYPYRGERRCRECRRIRQRTYRARRKETSHGIV